MTWNLKHVRELFFWLAIIALPLQTRWFQEGPSLGSFPWEQGRVSIYLSWIFIFICFLLRAHSLLFRRPCERGSAELAEVEDPSEAHQMDSHVPARGGLTRGNDDRWKRYIFLFNLFLFLLVLLHTSSVRATFQFCLEAIVLSLFVWSVRDLSITLKKFSLGFTFSLLPSVFFGLWQFAVQLIPRIKYLGIAAQDPLTRGVSVIEVGSERILRIYGAFPHPNIFAGWLVVAIILLALSLPLFSKRWQQWCIVVMGNLFLMTLILTFSRAALIALFVSACIFLLTPRIRQAFSILRKQTIVSFILLTMCVTGGAFWQTRHLWFVRAQTSTRLEQRSVDERTQAFRDGIQIFRNSLWLGIGPGAELLAVQKLHSSAQTPPVPPHLVWLILLNELGLIGVIAVLLIIRPSLSVVLARQSASGGNARTHPLTQSFFFPLLAALLTLSLFDHYLWTLWSGKTLFILVLLGLSFKQRTQMSPLDDK